MLDTDPHLKNPGIGFEFLLDMALGTPDCKTMNYLILLRFHKSIKTPHVYLHAGFQMLLRLICINIFYKQATSFTVYVSSVEVASALSPKVPPMVNPRPMVLTN